MIRLKRLAEVDHKGQVEYAVERDGRLVGYLRRTAIASYRMSEGGRYRLGLRGYRRYWNAEPEGASGLRVVRDGAGRLSLDGQALGSRTRSGALELLLAWVDR